MNFNKHFDLKDQHAFLGASNFSWINYDEEKLTQRYLNFLATQRGTDLHELAKRCILLGIKLPKNKSTLSMYVNDAIGFSMTPEQPLYYSPNAFGTCDSISFRDKKLRIHDLKTGVTVASFNQLLVYSALFCLEYNVDPNDIFTELRIYQSNDILICNPDPTDIQFIMDKIISFDKIINDLKE